MWYIDGKNGGYGKRENIFKIKFQLAKTNSESTFQHTKCTFLFIITSSSQKSLSFQLEFAIELLKFDYLMINICNYVNEDSLSEYTMFNYHPPILEQYLTL